MSAIMFYQYNGPQLSFEHPPYRVTSVFGKFGLLCEPYNFSTVSNALFKNCDMEAAWTLAVTLCCKTWALGYQNFFMFNSAKREILNAHKYKNIKKFSFIQALISLECCFSCS